MKHIKKFNENKEVSDFTNGSFDWDKLANALKDKFGESLVEEEDGEEDPHNWWLTDVTVTDIVDFIKNYKDSGIYESNVNESFKTKAQKLIDDTKKLKDDYPEKKYNKIIELEKLIDGTDEDKKKFVKSIMRLLGMTKSDLPDDLYRYTN
jgi:hypothetical protein